MARLIQQAQVYGLTQIQADLNAIKTSYEAAKVLYVKVAADPENEIEEELETAQESLDNLYAAIEAINGGQGGVSLASLKEATDLLNAQLNGSANVPDWDTVTKGTIVGLKNKIINDIVRLSFTKVAGEDVIDTSDVSTNIDKSDNTALTAYTTGNQVIVGANGTEVTFNLATGRFSADPYIVDYTASSTAANEQVVYTPFAGEFKVFPIGTWTLEDLPADALLDNQEMQTIAYAQALDRIVVTLAKDKNLIDKITQAVGAEAIDEAVQSATNVIDYRIDVLEGTISEKAGKAAVKVEDLVGAVAEGTVGEEGYVAAETVTVGTKEYTKLAVDQKVAAINATTDDLNSRLSILERPASNATGLGAVRYGDIVDEVKASTTTGSVEEGNLETVTDSKKTISETALVQKFADIRSEQAAQDLAFTNYTQTGGTADNTFVAKEDMKAYTKITAVNDTYTYAGDAAQDVPTAKSVFEKLSEIEDTIAANDAASVLLNQVEAAAARTADTSTGITAKDAETAVTQSTKIPTKTYVDYAVQDEAELRAKAIQDRSDASYDWTTIITNDGTAVSGNVAATSFNATTGVAADSTATQQLVAATTAETLSKTTPVLSESETDKRIAAAKSELEQEATADKLEIINRIAYNEQLSNEALTREIARLTARSGDTLVTPADGSDAVTATADGVITALDDKTADWSKITTSSGVTAVTDKKNNVIQAAVAAEAEHTENTQFASTQYVDDAVTQAKADLTKTIVDKEYDMDDRVVALEIVTDKVEVLTPEGNVITLTETPINGTLAIEINHAVYRAQIGDFSLSGTTVTFPAGSFGDTPSLTVADIADSVIATYKYNATVGE